VLIWINGPNGVGKTQAAFQLHRRLPGSFDDIAAHVGLTLEPDNSGPLTRYARRIGVQLRHVRMI